MAKTTALKVTQLEDVSTEVLAREIQSIAEGIRKLRAGRLNDRALFLLIQGAMRPKGSIELIRDVLNGIDALERTYLKR